MATHAVVAALSGLVLLAVFILAVGDPTRALAVWGTGAALGGVASLAAASNGWGRRLVAYLSRT